MKVSSYSAISASCLILAALCGTGRADITVAAVQQSNNFTFSLVPPSDGQGQCNVQAGEMLVPGLMEFLVENGTQGTLNIRETTADRVQLINVTNPSNFLQVQNGTDSITLQFTASGYTSPGSDVNFALVNNGNTECMFTIRILPSLSTSFTFDATQTPNITLSPFAPTGSDPRRNCFSSALRADNVVQGPFNILIPSGGTATVNFSSTTPVLLSGGNTGGITLQQNGTQLISAAYTASINKIPTSLTLGLGNPAQCGISIYFIPLPSTFPAFAPTNCCASG